MDQYSGNVTPARNASDPVEASWSRCRALGLQPAQQPGFRTLDPGSLSSRQKAGAELTEATENEVLPYFDNMLHNTDCRVVLADTNGVILQTWQPRERPEMALDGLRPGNVWDESSAGTNAIGTSLACENAIHIRADQHYLRSHYHLAGSAAPVYDARGDLAGCLTLCSTTKMPGDYTLGMVKLLSHGIENRLIFRTYQGDAHILKFNTSASGLDSSWAGLLVAGADGNIVAANRRARTMLGNKLTGTPLRQIFDLGLAELTAIATQRPTRLQARGNYQIFAQLLLPSEPVAGEEPEQRQNRPANQGGLENVERPKDVVAPTDLEHGDSRVRRLVKQA